MKLLRMASFSGIHITSPGSVGSNLAAGHIMSELGSSSQMLVPLKNQSTRTATVPLSTVIEYSVNKAYADIQRLVEILPTKSDMEKKAEIATFLSRTRHLFVRLLALVKWANSATKVDKCERITNFLDEQSMFLLETANFFSRMARETLVGVRLPFFGVYLAIDIFTKKTYTRLPTCIKKKTVPPGLITKWEKLTSLAELNRRIHYRLSNANLPVRMRTLRIANGRVKFVVKNEFQVCLTLMSDASEYPWRILDIDILVKDPDIGRGRPLVHSMQVRHLHQQIQLRLLFKNSDKREQLSELYDMLHTFCVSLQLELLHEQALRLIRGRIGSGLRLMDYDPCTLFSLSYWRDQDRPSDGSHSDASCVQMPTRVYSLMIRVDGTDSRKPLAVSHLPELSDQDQRSIGSAIRSEYISLESLLTRTIAVRCRMLMEELRMKLLRLSPGPVSLGDCPLALLAPILYPCLDSEYIRVTVDPQTGFLVSLMEEACPHMPAFLKALNEDSVEGMAEALSRMRIWLGAKRAERSVQHQHSLVTLGGMPFLPTAQHPAGSLLASQQQGTTHLVFIKLLKQNEHYLVVEPVNRGLEVTYRYYLLSALRCTEEGMFNEDGPFLRPGQFRRLCPEAVTILNPGIDPSDIQRDHYRARKTTADRKRQAVESMLARLRSAAEVAPPSENAPLSLVGSKRPRLIEESRDVGYVAVLPQMMAIAEDSIMMSVLLLELTRAGIQHSSVEMDCNRSLSVVHIEKFPETSRSIRAASNKLSNLLAYCTLRTHKSPRNWHLNLVLRESPLAVSSASSFRLARSWPVTQLEATGQVVQEVLVEWRAACILLTACHGLEENANLPGNAEITQYNLKSITVTYGPGYACGVEMVPPGNRNFQLLLSSGNPMKEAVGGALRPPMCNPHSLIREYLQNLLNKTTSLRAVLEVMMETMDFLITLEPLKDSSLIFHTEKDSSNHLTRKWSLMATSSHSVLVLMREQAALRFTLVESGLVRVEEGQDNSTTDAEPLVLFQEFLASVAQFFQIPNENGASLELSLDQVSQLLRPLASQEEEARVGAVSCLESYLGSLLLFHTASGHLRPPKEPNVFFRLEPLWHDMRPGRLVASAAGIRYELALTPLVGGLPQWRMTLTSRPITQQSSESWSRGDLDVLERYFLNIVCGPPFLPNALISFLRLLPLPGRALRDLIRIMEWEMAPPALAQTPHRIHLGLVGMVPIPGPQMPLGQPGVISGGTKICFQFGISRSDAGPDSPVHYLLLSYDAEANRLSFIMPTSPMISSGHQFIFRRLHDSPIEKEANARVTPDSSQSPLLHYFNHLLASQSQLW